MDQYNQSQSIVKLSAILVLFIHCCKRISKTVWIKKWQKWHIWFKNKFSMFFFCSILSRKCLHKKSVIRISSKFTELVDNFGIEGCAIYDYCAFGFKIISRGFYENAQGGDFKTGEGGILRWFIKLII